MGIENSPAIHGWAAMARGKSPGGTKGVPAVPAGTQMNAATKPSTKVPGYFRGAARQLGGEAQNEFDRGGGK
jgi:hypothetical protein